MVTYKGQTAEHIANSIYEAKVFVKELGCEREINNHIDQISMHDIEAIRIASSNDELRLLVRSAESTLLFMSDLFAVHGVLDTHGKGRYIANNLNAWDAFNGARVLAEYEIDRAIKRHLLEFDEPTEKQVESYMRSKPASYIDFYGLECDIKSEGSRAAIMMEVAAALEPFEAIDEVDAMGYGIVGDRYAKDGDRKTGIMFMTSRAGAEAVAKALPEYDVLDPKGNKITPPSKPAPKDPNLKI
jgi:hypothetical protein